MYLNHNLIEAVELGAASHVVVEGDWDDDLMKQVAKPGPVPALTPTQIGTGHDAAAYIWSPSSNPDTGYWNRFVCHNEAAGHGVF